MNRFTQFLSAFLFTGLFISSLAAQPESAQEEMADMMRSDGKIYVVVSVLAIIFIGIVIFLVSMDRKIRRLERNNG